MIKKDYIKFADMLVETYKLIEERNGKERDIEESVLEYIRERIAQIFIKDNPCFNYDKFNDYITNKTIGNK